MRVYSILWLLLGIFHFAYAASPSSNEERTVISGAITKSAQVEKAPNESGPASREIAITVAEYFIENRKYDEAEAHLKKHLDSDPTDSKAWKLLGQIAIKRNKLDEAKSHFEKAVATSQGKEKGINLYLLADVCQQAGDPDCAKKSLDQVGSLPGFSNQSKKFLNQLQLGVALSGLNLNQIEEDEKEELEISQRITSYSAILKSGFDNNVLYLSDLPTDLIPASYFLSPTLQALHLRKAWGGNLMLFGQAVGNMNFSSNATPYNSATAVAGGEWSVSSQDHLERWGINNTANVTLLNSSGLTPFATGDTLTPSWTHNFRNSESLQLQVPIGYTTYPALKDLSDIDVRSGPTFGANLIHRHLISSVFLSEQVGYQYQDSKGSNYQMHSVTGTLTAISTLSNNVNMTNSLGIGTSSYPQNIQSRGDKKLTFNVDLSKRLYANRPVSGAVNYAFERNISTISTADYVKHNFSIRVQYDFN